VDLAVVVLDANVLYPARLIDLFIRLAIAGMYRARSSDPILDDCFNNISQQHPELDPDRLLRTQELMNAAVADATVTNYGYLIDDLDLPDPNDRHANVAAIIGGETTRRFATPMLCPGSQRLNDRCVPLLRGLR
jgi:hypothetical protein